EGLGDDCAFRHCERSEAIQNLSAETVWIASSQELLAMTRLRHARSAHHKRKWPGQCPAIPRSLRPLSYVFFNATRNSASVLPLTILPGIIQLARSPFWATCMAPRIDRSMWPPRIMPKESALEKYEVVGNSLTVCLPALMRSASSSPS